MTRPSRRAALAAMLILLLGAPACSGEKEDVGAFCAAVAAAPSLDSLIRGFTAQNPVTLSRNLDDAQAAYDRIRGAAPSEIRDETAALVDAVDIVIDAVRENPDDRTMAAERIESALRDLGRVDADAGLVADAVSRHCDIDLNAGLVELSDDPTPVDETEPGSSTPEDADD